MRPPSQQKLAVSEAIIVIILVLIVLTIIFEHAKEHIEHSVDRAMKPIIESLFGELTVLGFLSLCTFCITKLGVFEELSVKIFGKNEAEELLEIFESVHFALFLVMVLFVLSVLNLVADGKSTEEEWIELEKSARNDQYIEQCKQRMVDAEQTSTPFFQRITQCLTSAFPSIRRRRNSSIFDVLQYYALRKEFILEREITPPFKPAEGHQCVPSDFNYSKYLSMSLGHTIAHSVHLGMTTWLCIAIFAILFFFVMMFTESNMVILSWIWAGIGVFLFVLANAFDIHLNNIRKNFGTFEIPNSGNDPESQLLVSRDDSSLPPWCSIDLDEYLNSRSWLTKKLAKATPNRQDSLFWFERRGPQFSTLAFQINLIFTSLYGALLLLQFLPEMHEHASSTGVFVAYVLVSVLPLLLTKIQRRHIAANMAQAISLGIHRKPHTVHHVLLEEKTARVVRAFVVINKLLYAAEHDLFVGAPASSTHDPAQDIGPVERADIEKVFDGFDADGSGTVSPQELQDILEALGVPITNDVMSKIMKTLDEDQSGSIEKNEFIAFYARNIIADNDNRSLKERANDMFHLFDKSGDNEITIEEFKHTLDALNFSFSVDEVGALVEELDEREVGTVGPHEFEYLLHKFESMFKSHAPREDLSLY